MKKLKVVIPLMVAGIAAFSISNVSASVTNHGNVNGTTYVSCASVCTFSSAPWGVVNVCDSGSGVCVSFTGGVALCTPNASGNCSGIGGLGGGGGG